MKWNKAVDILEHSLGTVGELVLLWARGGSKEKNSAGGCNWWAKQVLGVFCVLELLCECVYVGCVGPHINYPILWTKSTP